MNETELREHIARLITDILDDLFTYAAEQVALAVTPRAATGEPQPCACKHPEWPADGHHQART